MDMVALRTYCRERVAQGQADEVIEPLLDVIEQQSDRLQRSEQRVTRPQRLIQVLSESLGFHSMGREFFPC